MTSRVLSDSEAEGEREVEREDGGQTIVRPTSLESQKWKCQGRGTDALTHTHTDRHKQTQIDTNRRDHLPLDFGLKMTGQYVQPEAEEMTQGPSGLEPRKRRR